MSNSLQTNGLQHVKLPCPSLSLKVCSYSYLLSWWCYLTISSSATPFSFCLQSFPALGSLLMSQIFTSSGQRPKYWNFSFSISPSNEYSGLISIRIDWFDLFSVQGTLKSLLHLHNKRHKISVHTCSYLLNSCFLVEFLVNSWCWTLHKTKECNSNLCWKVPFCYLLASK